MPAGVPPGYNAVIVKTNAAKAAAKAKFGNGGGAFTSKPYVSPGSRGAHAATVKKAAPVKAARTKVSTPLYNPAAGVTSTPPAPTFDTSTLTPEDQALQANYDPSQYSPLDSTKLAGVAGKVQLPNALSYANNMAAMQYGPQINQVAQRIKGLTAALPDALTALDKAFANLDAQKTVQVINAQTSGQGVANLFGGATNAAGIAANQSAAASATAANQAGSLTDANAASATREADWETRIQLLNNMAVNQGRTDLAGLEGQKGAAQKAYYDQGLKTRGDMISQAISNQGAINNQRATSSLVAGQIEGLKISNEQKQLLLKQLGINVAAQPALLANQILQGKQNILTTISTRGVNAATAKAALKNAPGGPPTTLKGALSKGLDGAVQAMVLPATAIVQTTDASGKSAYQFNGDPNSYYNAGVQKLLNTFKDADPKQIRRYVSNQINVALQGAGRPWVYKGTPNGKGKFVKAKK